MTLDVTHLHPKMCLSNADAERQGVRESHDEHELEGESTKPMSRLSPSRSPGLIWLGNFPRAVAAHKSTQ